MKMRIWDDTAGALHGVNATGTAGGLFSPDNEHFRICYGIGANDQFDGHLDEIVVFAGEAISLGVNEDAHKIQLGTYGAAGGEALNIKAIIEYYYRRRRNS